MLTKGRLEWAAVTAATMLSWALVATTGCNMLTGADDMTLTLEDDDPVEGQGAGTGSSSGEGGSGASTSSGGGAGAGDTTTSTGTTTSGGGSGAGDTTGGGGNTTTTTEPQPCEYPPGPYGVAVGQTVPPNLSWQGFTPGSDVATTVTIQDFFDCDGTRGIDAVLFDTSQFG